MIYIERIPAPEGHVERARREIDRAAEFFLIDERDRPQRRYEFRTTVVRRVKEHLLQMFHGKCAYCESVLANALDAAHIEEYRPKRSVAESPDHPGYWWLSAEWDNLLIACPRCNTGKRNRFPIEKESERAFHPEADLSAESPLLLNPCVKDDAPEEHLVFAQSGMVSSATERGRASIAVLGLNRTDLVDARIIAAHEFTESYQLALLEATKGGSADLVAALDQLIADHQPYAAMKRQLVARLHGETLGVPVKATEVSDEKVETARSTFEEFQVRQEAYSLEDEKGRETFRQQNRLIEHIRIHNVKGISSLELDLTRSESDDVPWLMLLGKNATGKSTILHSVALTLVGAEVFATLVRDRGVRPRKYVRNRCAAGTVEVKLSGFRKPHKLVFRRSGVEFTSPLDVVTKVLVKEHKDGAEVRIDGESWEPQVQLLGYGSTRLLPRDNHSPNRAYSRVENLFDPFVPLFDAQRWLLGLDEKLFRRVVLVLRALLSLDEESEILRERGEVKFVNPNERVAIEVLSDGFQSAIALTVDILEALSQVWPRWDQAEGIVLLDEAGAHLHPEWQMKIVGSLRKALPGIQFVVTTHQPLCLRGLARGETVVLRKDEKQHVSKLQELPDPNELRVDQLLTSPLFGLLSPYDPEVEELFNEYYHLKALGEASLDAAQTLRLEELRRDLEGHEQLGSTPREQLMFEVIDELLARERGREQPMAMEALSKEAVERVRKIWQEQLEFE